MISNFGLSLRDYAPPTIITVKKFKITFKIQQQTINLITLNLMITQNCKHKIFK